MRRVVWLALVVSLCLTPVIAAEDDLLTGGRWWADKIDYVSRATKAAYVKGFWDRFQIDCSTEKRENIDSVLCPPNGILQSDSIEMGQIVTRVEIFYKDPRNRRIPALAAVEYVIFSLDGESPEVQLNVLNDLRKRFSQ